MEGACPKCGIHWGMQVEEREWCERNHKDFDWEGGKGVWLKTRVEIKVKQVHEKGVAQKKEESLKKKRSFERRRSVVQSEDKTS